MENNLILQMQVVVHACNKHFRRDLIEQMEMPILLANMFPQEREYFEMMLRKRNK